MRMTFLRALGAGLLLAAPLAAQAQAWPTPSIKIIVPFPPGGTTDQIARHVQPHLQQSTGAQILVENRAGASGAIGALAAAKSAPDGGTFLLVFDTHGVNPSLIPGMPFDTTKDLAPVMLVGTSPMAIVAHAGQPYKDFRDVLAAARAKPGAVSFGSIGTGSLGHLAMAQVGNQLGLEFNHIPYKGGGPLMIDAVGGQVPLAIGTVFLVNPHVKGGKVKALGVTSAKASLQMPGVAPIADQGAPGFSALAWWGVIAPAGTPAPIVKRMHEELARALRVPAVAEKLTAQGMDILGGTPEEFDAFLRGEIARWAKVVRDNRIKAGD